MAERLQGSDFQRFFLIRIRLLFHQEAQRRKLNERDRLSYVI